MKFSLDNLLNIFFKKKEVVPQICDCVEQEEETPKTQRYVSCPLIEHAIMFDHYNQVRVCSTINNVGGGRPLLQENYYGELLNWDEIFAKKRAHRELQKQGNTVPACEGCKFLQVRDWNSEDYITEVLLTHWAECNSNCSYCPVINNKKLMEDTKYYNILPSMKDAIKRNIIKKDALIEFAGGESTIHPEFEELMNLFVENDFENIVINTSAIKFSEAIATGIKNGQLKIVVSIDAGSKDVHERLKRVNSYDSVWESLKKYSEAKEYSDKKNLVRTKYIVVPGINDTKEEFDLFIKNNLERKIDSIAINVEIDWYQENQDNDTEELKKLLEYMLHKAKTNEMDCRIYPQAQWILEKESQY